jgi:hypothetical protein
MRTATNDLSQTGGPALKTTGSLSRHHGVAFPNPRQAIGDVLMRKPNGRPGPLLLVAACAAAVVGCSKDFVDEQFGVLDLSSVYDGGTASDPTAGLPTDIDPAQGFVDGLEAEYYDFGAVPVKRNPLTGEPQVAVVQQMFFFFDTAGRPLFSTTVREARDGTDWMKGGLHVLNPNPKDFCPGIPKEEQAKNPCHVPADRERKKAYGVRVRDPLVDGLRKVNDYQRPLIDVSPADTATGREYTGLWEMVEVTVADGYEPDSVKHKATLDKAIAAGKMRARPTGKVLNCPLIDERTFVSRGVADRVTPHPRIELWYRRQLTFCFLANGWETLGNDKGQLYPAGNDAQRVETFDVVKLAIGEGAVRQERLVVPVSRLYQPVVQTSDQSGNAPVVTRLVGNMLSRGLPRRTPADSPGYSPIRWMWDFTVGTDYASGALKSVDALDPLNADTAAVVKNVPLRGLRERCSFPRQASEYMNQCGILVNKDPMNPMKLEVDPSGDPVCNALQLECDPVSCSCIPPSVGYGQRCGPGLANCITTPDSVAPKGYSCFFGTYCHIACDGVNTLAEMNKDKKPNEYVDSRCNAMPGYQCLRAGNQAWCLKLCDSNSTDLNQCSAKVMVGMDEKDLGAGQTCQDLGVEVCTYPEGYTPAE